MIKKHSVDFGVSFDGDFDRCFFFDEKGKFIESDAVVALISKFFSNDKKPTKIVYDLRSIYRIMEAIESKDANGIISKTGHAFFKDKMKSNDAVYGGELSGHHYFKDFYYCDSGMIPWLIISEIVGKNGLLSKLAKSKKRINSSGELNLKSWKKNC